MSEVPYTPPPPPPTLPPVVPAGPQFDFAKPFTYVFEDPRWLQKILIGGLFYLAGFLIIGWFFIFGYVAQTARNIITGEARPLPEWDNLGDYFAEGLRLFGVALVYILPFVAVALAVMIPAGVLSSFENEGLQALGSGISGCVACLLVPFSLAVMLFLPASLLFAAVERRFGAAFDFSRIWSFIRANIGNYLLALVVYVIARFIAGTGIVLLCIGVVFTGFWSFLIATHGYAQAYRIATRP